MTDPIDCPRCEGTGTISWHHRDDMVCPDCEGDGEAECTCITRYAHPTDIEPPEPKLDPYCPTHGHRDADQEFEAWRERKFERGTE